MKSICVISDSHGRLENIKNILPTINSCEHLIFLGDGTGDLYRLRGEITTDVIAVSGNCDIMKAYPDSCTLDWAGHKFFITHGHKYRVKSELLDITYAARECGCDYVLFGHTHEACEEEFAGVKLINPGSISEARFGFPSYCVISEEKGNIFTKIISLRG